MPHFGFNRIQKAWTYRVIAGPAGLAVSLAEVKAYLRVTDTTQDAEITKMIEAATIIGELRTKRDFINKTFLTFRDNFSDLPVGTGINNNLFNTAGDQDIIQLRRSQLQSIVKIEFLKDDVLTLVDASVYYNTIETDFSVVLPNEDQVWPVSDVDNRLQAVQIEFIAGYGATEADVPADIQEAIIKHVQVMFDGGLTCETPSTSLPDLARRIYLNNRIMDLSI